MFTGHVKSRANLVLHASNIEITDKAGHATSIEEKSPLPITTERPFRDAFRTNAGNPNFIGIRLTTFVDASITLPDQSTRQLISLAVETGPRQIIGQLVTQQYLQFIANDPPAELVLWRINELLDRPEDPVTKVIKLSELCYILADDTDQMVDPEGKPVTDVLDAPEGWVKPTRFEGTKFLISIVGNLIRVDVLPTHGPIPEKYVTSCSIEKADEHVGLLQRLAQSFSSTSSSEEHAEGDNEPSASTPKQCSKMQVHFNIGMPALSLKYWDVSDPTRKALLDHQIGKGVITFNEPGDVKIEAGSGLHIRQTLRLTWDGKTLSVILRDND
jgi:hypothetical protein